MDTGDNICTCNPDGSGISIVRQSSGYKIAKINSYGSRIFFAEYTGGYDDTRSAYNYDVYAMDFDGSNITYLYSGLSYGVYINLVDGMLYVLDYAYDPYIGYMTAITGRMDFSGGSFEFLPR